MSPFSRLAVSSPSVGVCTRAVAALLLALAFLAHAAAAEDRAEQEGWRAVRVGEVGWVGARDTLATDAETQELVRGMTHLSVWSAEHPRGYWILYYPSPSGATKEQWVALAGAHLEAGTGPPSVSNVEIERFGPRHDASATAEKTWPISLAAAMSFDKARAMAWYVHPYRRALVQYDVLTRVRRDHPLPRIGAFLQPRGQEPLDRMRAAVQPEASGTRVDIAVAGAGIGADESLTYVSFALRERNWSSARIGSGLWPSLFTSRRGVVVVCGPVWGGPLSVYRRVWEDEAAIANSARPMGHGEWQRQEVPDSRYDYRESSCAVLDAEGRLHVVHFDVGPRGLWDTHEGPGGWAEDLIVEVPRGERERAQDRLTPEERGLAERLELVPSAALDRRGELHVAYYKAERYQVMHAWREGKVWREEPVGHAENAGTVAIVAGDASVLVAWTDLHSGEVWAALRAGVPKR